MQNNVMILRMACVLRLLWSCLAQLVRGVVLPRMHSGHWGLGAFSLTADLDSARLDVVSRSLWWGSGAPVLKPVPIVARPPSAAPRVSRWHGIPPETFHRWDH
ncbi:MAG TPA: hypothetical protein VGH74_19425 [Planctomycetaceae bacterium]|jgi:hypothetical protein